MQLLFLTHISEDPANGVWKKISAQVNSLRAMGYQVDFTYLGVGGQLVIETGSSRAEFPLFHRYLCFYKLSRLLHSRYDKVYIRKPHGGLYSLAFAKLVTILRQRGAETIFMEIPTWPFRNEVMTFRDKVSDFLFENQMKKVAKKIDTLLCIGSDVKTLYQRPVKNIINGIALDPAMYIKPQKKENNKIMLLAIANLSYWHGYDRLIKGILAYQGSTEVTLTIIGDTEPEWGRLKKIAANSPRIIFTGSKNSQQIQSLIQGNVIAVDSLGRHRSGNNFNSSIKSKEYTLMGLPFLMSHHDSAFEANLPFIYHCPADESPIDIQGVINWYQGLPEDLSLIEHDYAVKHFSWQGILSAVL